MKPLAVTDIPPVCLRLPSVLFCSVALGTLVVTVSRNFGNRMANFLGIGLATSPGWIFIAHYARPYALLAMLFVFSICSLVAVLKEHLEEAKADKPYDTGRWPWIALAASTSAASIVMMAGVLYSFVLVPLPYLNSQLRHDRNFMKRWWLAMTPVLATAIAMTALLKQSIVFRSDRYWTENRYPLSLKSVWNVFIDLFTTVNVPNAVATLVVVSALILMACSMMWRRRYPVLFWSLMPMSIGLPIVYVLISFKTSLMVPRYFYLVAPAWYCLIAASASVVWTRRWMSILLVGLTALVVFQYAAMLTAEGRISRWYEFAAAIRQSENAPDAILARKHVNGRRLKFLFEHAYTPTRPIDTRSWSPHDGLEELTKMSGELAAQYSQVWLVGDFTRAEIEALLQSDNRLAGCSRKVGKINVDILYRKDRTIPLSRPACRRDSSKSSGS